MPDAQSNGLPLTARAMKKVLECQAASHPGWQSHCQWMSLVNSHPSVEGGAITTAQVTPRVCKNQAMGKTLQYGQMKVPNFNPRNLMTSKGSGDKFSSPYYPQSNGKNRGHCQSIEKLSPHHGMADRWIMTICVKPSYNIEIPPSRKNSLSPV